MNRWKVLKKTTRGQEKKDGVNLLGKCLQMDRVYKARVKSQVSPIERKGNIFIRE